MNKELQKHKAVATDKIELFGYIVKHEFDDCGSHRLSIGALSGAWKSYQSCAIIRMESVVFVGLTAYFGKEIVQAFSAMNNKEACKAVTILGVL